MLAEDLPDPEAEVAPADRTVVLGRGAALQSRAAAMAALAAQTDRQPRPVDPVSPLERTTEGAQTRPVVATGSATGTWRAGWTALTLTTLSRGLLSTLAGLLLWSLAPVLLGWHPTVVQTGSMQPRLHPGDVAVSRPVPAATLALGQVLLVQDPDHPGRLRLHRLAAMNADGTLTLRGDANAANDSSPVQRSAVRGVASLRIPYLGIAELWRAQRNLLGLGVLAAVLGGLAGCCRLYRPVADGQHDGEQDVEHDGPGGGQHEPDRPPTAAARPAAAHRRPRPGSGVRRLTTLSVILLGIGGTTVAVSARAQAASRFNRITSNPASTWSTVPYFTCKSAVLAASPYFYYRLGEASGSVAADASGNSRSGSYQGTRPSYGVAGSCARDSSTAVTLDGTSSYISTPTAVADPTVFTEEIWFRTRTSAGGDLIGFGNSQSGAPSSYDRLLYLTNSGQVVFGLYPGVVRTIVSPKSYNDGGWHLADAALSSAGMQLYLDGQLVAADAGVSTAQSYTGYWRIGYDSLAGWTSAPTSNFLNATIDDAAVYPTALTAAQIAGHYSAS